MIGLLCGRRVEEIQCLSHESSAGFLSFQNFGKGDYTWNSHSNRSNKPCHLAALLSMVWTAGRSVAVALSGVLGYFPSKLS